MTRISDIACKLNLSIATVSNALTGKGRMTQQTRDAVLACALEMGYPISTKAKTSQQLPIIIAENLNGIFTSAILCGILDEANALNLTIPVYSLQLNTEEERRHPSISHLNGRVHALLDTLPTNPSGIIYISQYVRQMDGLLTDLSIPVISVYCYRDDHMPCVHYDDRQGAYLAVQTLLKENRKKIAMVSGPIDSLGMYLRSSGYQQALMEHQLPYDPKFVSVGDWSEQSGYEQTKQLLAYDPTIDGIFAQNDFICRGAVTAITEKGLSIPTDISVIGFDDTLPCRITQPSLSTIKPPFSQMGQSALHMLLSLLGTKKEAAISQQLLPCSLVIRESTRLPDESA